MQYVAMGQPCPPQSRSTDAMRLARLLVYMLTGSIHAVGTGDRQVVHGKNENRLDVMYTH